MNGVRHGGTIIAGGFTTAHITPRENVMEYTGEDNVMDHQFGGMPMSSFN
jgi:hypothetical protein